MTKPDPRRRTPRVSSRFPLRYRQLPVSGPEHREAGAEDLSCGGMRFRCPDSLRARSGILVELMVPGAGPVSSFARVAWTKELPGKDGFEVGVRFEDQSTAVRRSIEKLLRGQAPPEKR